ncbi:MAG TPA: heavy-metal-associated domain-containing protein, partial [Candidatus Polarisedimenticolia bacterium]|nr:heavy-metal-associated domain-containing protein [Candidatus Polarisedimenticolia bacterium]
MVARLPVARFGAATGFRAAAGRVVAAGLVTGFGLVAAPPALAAPAGSIGIVKVTFKVGNLISPLSTRGVEEAIKRLPGVGEVHADSATGVVQVIAAERMSLDLAQVRDRAARAGFPPQGEPDLEARGRFEIGREGKIVFRPAGTGSGWQVLESAQLLALFRVQPRLAGEYLIDFRLH